VIITDKPLFDSPPKISDELMASCRKTGDFRPVIFQWYRHVGLLAIEYACIENRGAIRTMSSRHFATLKALLARCSKLMRSVLVLSADGGGRVESTTIFDRSIVESATKVRWLCQPGTEERFDRFVADGLKSELRLKENIEKHIALRGHEIVIERRMLRSIAKTIAASGLSEADIRATKQFPSYETMLHALGADPLRYIVSQRIGSHAVHGTWAALYLQYLEEEPDGTLTLSDGFETHINQYFAVSLMVLEALEAFARFITSDDQVLKALIEPISDARDRILELFDEAGGSDHDPA
jgi:hypothetical protein